MKHGQIPEADSLPRAEGLGQGWRLKEHLSPSPALREQSPFQPQEPV